MQQGYAYQGKSLGIMTFLMLAGFHTLVLAQSAAPIESKGYDKASYQLSEAGKFMQHWMVAGPFAVTKDSIEPTDDIQEKSFKADFSSQLKVMPGQPALIATDQMSWQLISQNKDIIDLDSVFKGKDFVYAYAMAEIRTEKAVNAMLAVGSDDGIRIWLNGKLVHDNWIPRGVEKDDDVVPLQLEKGSNQLLMKVQDIKGGWAFTARLLNKSDLAGQLTRVAAAGSLDQAKLLIDHGADVNAADKNGTTALEAAKIAGRNGMIQLLLKKGATDKKMPSAELIADRYYTSLNKSELPGVALLVAKDGQVLYKKGFGYADVKNKLKVTPETKFRIGSVTKQFTAAAILRLQEKGLLSVQDKLSKYIPDFPRGDEVTIHHLLTHTSGIHSYTNKGDFLDRVTKTITPDSLIASFKNDPYDFNPGEQYRYNNSGYFLLGYIISRVSGMPYEKYLKQTFFDPLQMNNTGVHYAGIKLEREAKGYTKDAGKYSESLNWDMSWAGGAGAMYSTVGDLLKWNQALHNGKVLSEKSYKAAITPVKLNSGEEPSPKYGYGLGMQSFRGLDVIGHSGGLHGFLTQLVFFPKEKLTVAMFTNTSDPEVNFNPDRIAEAYLWHKLDSQASYAESAIKPKNLEAYNGRYELSYVGVMTVTAENDKLFAQLSGQPRFEIFPASEDEFFWKVVDARLKFGRNEKGEITHATLYQNGQELKAKKLAEEKIVEIDPSILDNYTGKYKLNNDITVIILKENNKLIAHPTGQSKLEMLPLSETEFVIKEINAKLNFVKGENGKVTKVILNMNGGNTDMPRIE